MDRKYAEALRIQTVRTFLKALKASDVTWMHFETLLGPSWGALKGENDTNHELADHLRKVADLLDGKLPDTDLG